MKSRAAAQKIERSCVLIKPDGVLGRRVGRVIDRFESEGLRLVGMKLVKPSRKTWLRFYSIHIGKYFFGPFLQFMLSGPAIACVWEGKNAVARIRKFIGATDSRAAAKGTLRKQYGTDNRRNLVHASDSPASARREVRIMFARSELC